MTESVQVGEVRPGKWYPDVPPGLPGETDDTYSSRLLGVGGLPRPYDHARNRQCSLGYHSECSDPDGTVCKCPHHRDVSPAAELITPNVERAAGILARLYYLPVKTTATRVMAEAAHAISDGQIPDVATLALFLEGLYDSKVGSGFAIDVANILGHSDLVTNAKAAG